MWCRSAVNFSCFLVLAIRRMRSSACDTLSRPWVRHVLCCSAFSLVPVLGSTASAAFASVHALPAPDMPISCLTHTPHATAVYASCSALLPPHATLASRRPARPYLGRTCTDGSRQLRWRLRSPGLRASPSAHRDTLS